MPNSTVLKTITLSDGTYNNTLPLEDTTARNSIASLSASLAPVATSGSYNDLANKPTIPEELVVDFSQNGSTWECDTPVLDIINAMASNVRVYALKDGLIFEGVRYISSDGYVEFIARSKSMIYCLDGTYNGVVDDWNLGTYTIVDYDDYQSDMAGKQNTLVSGTNIKTINGQSLLGSGNITIQGGGGGGDVNVIEVVKVNGSALSVDSNKAVDITAIPWSIVTNKPTIPDVSGKADKVSGGVTGHIAELDSNGNLADGGVLASDVEDAVTNKHTHSNKTLLDKIPSSLGSAGQALCVNNAANGLEFKNISGGGGLTDYDFAHEYSQGVSGTVTVTYAANQRGTRMVCATADIAIAFVCNNAADNYLWVKNNHGSNDIDVTISSVQYGGSQMTGSKIFVPDDSITIAPGYIAEIGIICNYDGAFITARCDLKANS